MFTWYYRPKPNHDYFYPWFTLHIEGVGIVAGCGRCPSGEIVVVSSNHDPRTGHWKDYRYANVGEAARFIEDAITPVVLGDILGGDLSHIDKHTEDLVPFCDFGSRQIRNHPYPRKKEKSTCPNKPPRRKRSSPTS